MIVTYAVLYKVTFQVLSSLMVSIDAVLYLHVHVEACLRYMYVT